MKVITTNRSVAFASWIALIAVLGLPAWIRLLQVSIEVNHYSHIPLMPVVTAVLLYQERSRIFTGAQWSVRLGVPVFILGIAIYATSWFGVVSLAENDKLSMSVFGLVVAWFGAVLTCFGTGVFRAGLFSFLFPLLAVPIPDFLLEGVILFLLWGSTETTDILFRLAGTSVYRVGSVFHLANVSIEVARECSGIRSSLAMFITCLLASHLFLQSLTRKTILVVATIPLLILKNGVRIVTLTLLAVHVDSGFLTGRLHNSGGVVFFSAGLLVMWLILRALAKGEKRDTNAQPPSVLQTPAPRVSG